LAQEREGEGERERVARGKGEGEKERERKMGEEGEKERGVRERGERRDVHERSASAEEPGDAVEALHAQGEGNALVRDGVDKSGKLRWHDHEEDGEDTPVGSEAVAVG
jgi:hypothetical protein